MKVLEYARGLLKTLALIAIAGGVTMLAIGGAAYVAAGIIGNTSTEVRCQFQSCIVSQGVKMTRSDAIEISEDCRKFTLRHAGATAMEMSSSDASAAHEQGGINHPLVQA